MSGIVMISNGHKLEVQLNTMLSPVEIVTYDGVEQSKKSSWFGTTHAFDVVENGENVHYEVITRMALNGAGCTVTRNGQLIFTHT